MLFVAMRKAWNDSAQHNSPRVTDNTPSSSGSRLFAVIFLLVELLETNCVVVWNDTCKTNHEIQFQLFKYDGTDGQKDMTRSGVRAAERRGLTGQTRRLTSRTMAPSPRCSAPSPRSAVTARHVHTTAAAAAGSRILPAASWRHQTRE